MTPPSAVPASKPPAEPAPSTGRDSGREPSGRRFAAVDGLRGAAVLAVLLRDTGAAGRWFSWAGTGVDVLLVLSGFLTTLPLLRTATATGGTGAVGFLARRAKRLTPALLMSVAMTLALCWMLGSPRVIRELARQVPSALLGYGDWGGWAHGRLPGAVRATDSPLAPLRLWDLTAGSVLAWSLVLAFLGLLARRRLFAVAPVAVLIAGMSAVAAARGALPGVATVTGMQALAPLAGAGAACLVHLVERGGRAVSRPAAVLLTTTSLAVAAALAVSAALRRSGQGGDWYAVVVVLGAAVLTAVLCGGLGPLARLLSVDLLTEIGRMSYSLFLLHLPVYWLLQRGQPGVSPLALFLVGGAAAWFLSLLVHYLLVERLGTRPWRPGRAVPLTLAAYLAVVAGAYALPVLTA
ncbi:acyltransferase family protein [Streptomyces sp. NPDC049687]|uniref:acyltransferase family protein n=1 Tax=Streptomyces sp. NPDC049687 TaxID=3365596 RepID=UPI0037AE4574